MATRGWENATATDTRHRRALATMPQKQRSKYGAVKVTIDGRTFDSKAEGRRYAELRVLEQSGHIRALQTQPRFPLWAHTGVVNDPPVRIGEYRGDFSYEEWTGKSVGDRLLCPSSNLWRDVVEDVKGVKTPLYRWKKKHVEAQYGIQIREIR